MRSVVFAQFLALLCSPVLSFPFAGPVASLHRGRKVAAAFHGPTRGCFARKAVSPAAAGKGPTQLQPAGPGVDGGDGGDESARRAKDLVTKVLDEIEGTNRGIDCTPEQRQEIDRIIEQLNTLGEDRDWLKDPLVYGNYNVAYVSAGSSQRGSPAGGRWRGRIGRSLFRTEDLFQHLVEPSTAVNMIVFRAFGILKGCVTLCGEFEAVPDRPNFVKASFGPPLVNFLGKRGLTIQSGPNSSVYLAATYVDDRIRLGKGGRGSLFVFTRGGAAESPKAEEWRIYAATSARPAKARRLGAAAACGAVAAAVRSAFLPAGILALVSAVLIATRGGIISGGDAPDEPPPAESAT